jgi:AraC-like DNA-binding protein
MQLSFAMPCPSLRRHALTYYLFEDPSAMIEDVQRADVGALTFTLEGSGHYDFADGRRSPTRPVFINGPTTTRIAFTAFGPLRFVGISPQPDFWGGIIDSDARTLADTAVDGAELFRTSPMPLLEELRLRSTIEDMAPLLDAWLLSAVRLIHPEQVESIEKIRSWLATEAFPSVADLYAQFDVTERQVARIANRYFGAAPKALSRKYGALRTASAIIMEDDDMLEAMKSQFADASHMIREIRKVIGQTPRQLRRETRMLMRLTLQPENFRELLPVA